MMAPPADSSGPLSCGQRRLLQHPQWHFQEVWSLSRPSTWRWSSPKPRTIHSLRRRRNRKQMQVYTYLINCDDRGTWARQQRTRAEPAGREPRGPRLSSCCILHTTKEHYWGPAMFQAFDEDASRFSSCSGPSQHGTWTCCALQAHAKLEATATPASAAVMKTPGATSTPAPAAAAVATPATVQPPSEPTKKPFIVVLVSTLPRISINMSSHLL